MTQRSQIIGFSGTGAIPYPSTQKHYLLVRVQPAPSPRAVQGSGQYATIQGLRARGFRHSMRLVLAALWIVSSAPALAQTPDALDRACVMLGPVAPSYEPPAWLGDEAPERDAVSDEAQRRLRLQVHREPRSFARELADIRWARCHGIDAIPVGVRALVALGDAAVGVLVAGGPHRTRRRPGLAGPIDAGLRTVAEEPVAAVGAPAGSPPG